MNSNQWLALAIKRLNHSTIVTARLDALILLEDVADVDRAWLLAHPEFELSEEQVTMLETQIERRVQHEPLAYIRGKTEFYGREFYIDHRVLQPRSESEAIVDLLKSTMNNLHKDRSCTIIDIGTGSGALAISAKLEMPEIEVIATDIDPACLVVARKNAQKLNAKITFLQADLLSNYSNLQKPISRIFCVLANLPYVPAAHTINQAAMHEPPQAIFGGSDGLDLYRRLFEQLCEPEFRPAFVLTESLPPQHSELVKIAFTNGYELIQTNDFIQLFANL